MNQHSVKGRRSVGVALVCVAAIGALVVSASAAGGKKVTGPATVKVKAYVTADVARAGRTSKRVMVTSSTQLVIVIPQTADVSVRCTNKSKKTIFGPPTGMNESGQTRPGGSAARPIVCRGTSRSGASISGAAFRVSANKGTLVFPAGYNGVLTQSANAPDHPGR